jgi:hypothetical protein
MFVRFKERFLIQLARWIFNEKFLEETQTCSSETTQIGSIEHTECHSLISVPIKDGEREGERVRLEWWEEKRTAITFIGQLRC